jgi:alkylation response protein AidB-like acyl-CoA dehydrogenase
VFYSAAVDFDESPEEAAFRAEARAWLEGAASSEPARGLRGGAARGDADWVARAKPWQAHLADHGWAGITWPKDAGGRGGTASEQAIFTEEAARLGLSVNAFAVGIAMAGPTIIAHGTEEQRRRYLPSTLRGDEVWCQLFSEPGAGSDLAALSTRAVRDGDEWVVTGQKVWTSGAHHSDLGILLARTDLDQPKHRGITYFLIDMHSPGIEVRPLRQMTGASHFSEVFFTEARIPHDRILGEVNGGWGVAMTTLANERTMMGGGSSGPVTADLVELARQVGVADDAVIRQGLAASYSRAQIMTYLGYRSRTRANHGLPPGPESSVRKVFAAWNLKHNGELALAVQGASGMLVGADAPSGGSWQQSFLGAPSIRIAGGSDEIQRNVMGERTLGLPTEPRPDKGIPFREL